MSYSKKTIKKIIIASSLIERYKLLVLSLLFFLIAILIETSFFTQKFSAQHASVVEHVIRSKQTNALQLTEQLAALPNADTYNTYRKFYKEHSRMLENQEISIFIADSVNLIYWSNNQINITIDSLDATNEPLIFVNNAWYLYEKKSQNGINIYLLTLIKQEYTYENEYLKNHFHSDFNLSPFYTIHSNYSPHAFEIQGLGNNTLFWLSTNKRSEGSLVQKNLSISLYFLGIIFFLLFYNYIVSAQKKQITKIILNASLLLSIVAIRIWMITNKIPYVFYTNSLFDSSFFASSHILPSLGDFAINSLLLFYFIFQLSANISKHTYSSTFSKFILQILFVIIPNAMIVLVAHFIKTLTINSNIYLELYNLFDSNFLSFVVYAILGVALYSYFWLNNAFFEKLSSLFSSKTIYILISVAVGVHLLLCITPFSTGHIITVLFLASSLLLQQLKTQKQQTNFFVNYQSILLVVSILFLQFYMHQHIQKKHVAVKKTYAQSLTNEQDPITELLLKDLRNQMIADTALVQLMRNPIGNETAINTYLQKKYYSGFLNKYNLETTVCGSSPTFSYENSYESCEAYFTKLLKENGEYVPSSQYYFLHNMSGGASYFDSLSFTIGGGISNKLYIELHTKPNRPEVGYPRLLLQNEFNTNSHLQQYSYATYKDNLLLHKKGTAPYSLNLRIHHKDKITEYQHLKYNHIMYNVNDTMSIIVSHKPPTFFNHVVWFSYLFIFYFIILWSYSYMPTIITKKNRQHTFTEKIRFSLFAVLFVSMILTGVSIVLINTNQQTKNQQKNIKEKLQSIVVELYDFYENYSHIPTNNAEELEMMLMRFSHVYFTDINFFSPQGSIVASSRPEIFEYNLVGNKINPRAYYGLHYISVPEFVIKEHIGNLSYTSAYAVLTNSKNKVLGYVNLPYFNKQAEFSQQTSSLIVAILNIYVILLMLAAIFAVFISNKITYPLVILRDKMKHIAIGTKNEKIQWGSTDEIGDLIHNYNNMIDELDSNIQKLAESEREGAWREMAKQIAHEIKNPLTPIKLNIQLLNKSWESNDPKFETRLRLISQSIIEQIDTLADTASAFSNFAKLTKGQQEKIDIKKLIESCVLIFKQTDNIQFYEQYEEENIYVKADNESLIRLFNNILKNAIQAIPASNTQGKITIKISSAAHTVLIIIQDNGIGIPEAMQKNLFEPAFTTKSTGSGFGLAIAKKIVEAAQGTIWFETEENQGTSFFIELPKYI